MTSRVKVKVTESRKQQKELPRYPVYKGKRDRDLIFPLQDGSKNVFAVFEDGSFGVHKSCEIALGPEVKLNIEAEEV